MKYDKEIEVNGQKYDMEFQQDERADTVLVCFEDEKESKHSFTVKKNEAGNWNVPPEALPHWDALSKLKVADAISDHEGKDNGEFGCPDANSWDVLGR